MVWWFFSIFDTTVYALNRIEHGKELFQIDEEDLVLVFTPFQRKYDSDVFAEAQLLPEKERGFETGVHGSSQYFLESGVDADYQFDINLEHGTSDMELYTEQIYPDLLEEVEAEYEQAEIIAPEPYILSHFFIEEDY